MNRSKLLTKVKLLHLTTLPDWLGSGLIHLLIVVLILKAGYLPVKKTEIVWISLSAAILQPPMLATVTQENIVASEQQVIEPNASAFPVAQTDGAELARKPERHINVQDFNTQPSVLQPKPSSPLKIRMLSKIKKKTDLIDSVNISSQARPPTKETTKLSSTTLSKEKSLPVETIETIETLATPVAAQAEYLQVNFEAIRSKVSDNLRYPVIARRQGWHGQVQIKFIILLSGEVDDLQILSSSGYPFLDQQALRAIKISAPFPAPSVVANITIPVKFELN